MKAKGKDEVTWTKHPRSTKARDGNRNSEMECVKAFDDNANGKEKSWCPSQLSRVHDLVRRIAFSRVMTIVKTDGG